MEKQLLNRKVYKDIKRFDRQEMEEFLKTFYSKGYQDGFQDGSESGQQVDFKIELVQLLEGIKGVGPKTKELILSAYKERTENYSKEPQDDLSEVI